MEEKKKSRFSVFSRLMIVLLTILALLSAVVTVLEKNGLTLRDPRIKGYLILGVIGTAILWGIYGILGRIRKQTWKMVVGSILGGAGILVLFLVYYYFTGFMLNLQCSDHYATVPQGDREIEILYNTIPDALTFEEKYGSQPVNGLIPEDCYYYLFVAYPRKGGLFLDTKGHAYPLIPFMEVEGEEPVPYVALWPGEDGKPHLLMEWIDGDTLRLYAEEPIYGGSEILIPPEQK